MYYGIMLFKSESFLPEELKAAKTVAFNAANDVAKTLKENFGASEFFTKTDERDWATKWDGWAEERIRDTLGKFSVDVGFMGEEGGIDGNPVVYWTIDPIDGTSHFVRGNELCTTMIALVDRGVPVASVIYDFMHDTAYTAVSGQGAFKNLEPIHVSERPMSTAYLEAYTDENTERGKSMLESIRAAGAYLLRNASAGYTMLTVARGSTEGFLSLRNPFAKEWDIAPGTLLIHEAGGVVRNIDKQDFNLKDPDFIAANELTFTILHRLVEQNQSQYPS